ncbi:MAG: ABC transporter ATP-binding protein [Candidatus Heimdallarchaeaceae archaeon]
MVEIKVKDVYKIYQSGTLKQRIETVALRGVSLDIKTGDFITVMGPSGAGKTTLLNILGGLDTPSAGSIIYEDGEKAVDISKLSETELDYWRHDKIGVVFQSNNLFHHLTALENVELPLKFLGQKDRNRAVELLERLGLGDRINHRTHQLSAGERQRVALASALIFKPKIILADEPTGELDSQTLTEVMDIFKEIHQEEDVIFFIVTHNPTVAKYGNRYFTLSDGRIEERDTPFSYADFPSSHGEYVVNIDRAHRLLVPHDLLQELDPSEGIVEISAVDSNTIKITKPDMDGEEDEDSNLFISQVDLKGRILLPRELRMTFKGSKFSALFDEDEECIILEKR